MTGLNDLGEPIYLFGGYFPVAESGDDKIYPKWNEANDNKKNLELKKVRPLPCLPIAVNIDSESPMLWGSNEFGQLYHLGVGVQVNPSSQSFELLRHCAPIHKLIDSSYKLTFPQLSVLAELAASSLNAKTLCQQLTDVVKTIKNKDGKALNSLDNNVSFAVTEIAPSQLAAKYENETGKTLTDAETAYNQWLDGLDTSKPLKGFLLPTFAFCGVVFSTPDYAKAKVSLLRFAGDENGSEELIGKAIAEWDEDSQSKRPCALLPIDPEKFQDGMYTIRVEFILDDIQEMPSFLNDVSDVTKEYDDIGALISVTYELREYISLSQTAAFGKLAVVCGDMISLEESLMYQFPELMTGLQQYKKGEIDKLEAVGTTADMTGAIWEVASKVGVNIAEAGHNIFRDPSSKHDAIGALSKAFWANVDKKNLPDAMIAGTEFLFGVSSTKAAFDTLQEYRQAASAAEKAKLVGSSGLLKNYLFDSSKFIKNVWTPVNEGKYTTLAGKLSRSWYQMGFGSMKAGVTSFGGFGFNLFSTYFAIKDMKDKTAKLKLLKELSDLRSQHFELVAKDYLRMVPVWETQRKTGMEILDALFAPVKDQLTLTDLTTESQRDSADKVSFIQDERGVGLKLLFNFDADKVEEGKNLAYLSKLAEVVKGNPQISIEIEGHACQNGSSQYNYALSEKRANYVAGFFDGIDQSRISIALFGEDKPVVSASGDEINKSNAELKKNRRVEVRIYVSELALRIPPSRSASRAMELSRLAEIKAELNEDTLEKELVLAIYESLIGVACFIPGIALPARGLMLVKEGTKLAISAAKLLDQTLFDSHLNALLDENKKLNQLDKLAKQSHDMLVELSKIDEELGEKNFTSKEALIVHLNSEGSTKELIKRYKMRALALNGLLQLIAESAQHGKSQFAGKLKEYDIEGYIATYIERDDWQLKSNDFNSLSEVWRQTVNSQTIMKTLEVGKGRAAAAKDMERWDYANGSPGRMGQRQRPTSTLGAFNKAFPIQDKLFLRDKQNGMMDFARQLNPFARKIEDYQIGFIRLLVAEPDKPTVWRTYERWFSDKSKLTRYLKKPRLSPFHRLKWQVVLWQSAENDMRNNVFQADISYCRKECFDVSGPKFKTLFYPMAMSDFSVDCDGDLKAFFEHPRNNKTPDEGEKRLVATEFEPFYYFGDTLISGVKPLVAESELDYRMQLPETGNLIMLAMQYFSNNEDTLLASYAAGGGFRNMDYCFTLSGQNYSFDLSPGKTPTTRITNPTRINVGVHSEHSHKIDDISGFGNVKRTIRESDLLIPEFVTEDEVYKGVPSHVIGKPKAVYLAVHYNNHQKFINERGMDRFKVPASMDAEGFSWSRQSPFKVSVLFISDKHNKDDYEAMGQDWKCVATTLQLAITVGNKEQKGPIYRADMKYLGKLSHKEKQWVISADADSLKPNDFVNDALTKINPHDGLSEEKDYVVYSVEFDLDYISLAGNKIRGLKPFGKLLNKDKDTFKDSVLKVAAINHVNTPKAKPFEIPVYQVALSGKGDLMASPFAQDGKSGVYNVNKDLAERWKNMTPKERRAKVRTWIMQPEYAQLIEPLDIALETMSESHL